MTNKTNFKILSTLPPIQEVRETVDEIGTLEVNTSMSRDELLEKVRNYDAILAGDQLEFNGEVFEKSEGRLKIVARVGIGYDNVDLNDATQHGVMATNTPGVMAESVAEHAILLMLAASNNLPLADKEIRDGQWEWEKYRGMELWSRTLGLIGFGRIGNLVARKARQAFSMRVLVYDPYVEDKEIISVGAKKTRELDKLLVQSDVISINTPLTEETRHLIGKEEFELMKDTSIIVNTGRGAVIDEKALIDALKEGEIAKAGLDVLEQEPPASDNPLFELENVVLTSHIASNTETGVKAMFLEATNNVLSALKGSTPQFLLNKEVLDS